MTHLNKEQVMNRDEEFVEGWGAAITGTVLVALPLAGWAYRGTLSWMDIVVVLIGITALVFALEDFLRRRQLMRALQTPRRNESLSGG
jgi:ABC-type enterobactin transport system permease subunit